MPTEMQETSIALLEEKIVLKPFMTSSLEI